MDAPLKMIRCECNTSNLEHIQLNDGYLLKTTVNQSNLKNAQLTGAYLKYSTLSQNMIQGIDFRHTHLTV